MTSPDGINWTLRTSAADNQWISVTYGNGLFVAVAYSGTGNRVMTSPDGINWTLRTSAADNQWRAVTYGNGLFVAVAQTGTGNRVMTSGWETSNFADGDVSRTPAPGKVPVADGDGGLDSWMRSTIVCGGNIVCAQRTGTGTNTGTATVTALTISANGTANGTGTGTNATGSIIAGSGQSIIKQTGTGTATGTATVTAVASTDTFTLLATGTGTDTSTFIATNAMKLDVLNGKVTATYTATASDIGAVSTSVTVCSHPLSTTVSCSAADVSAVETNTAITPSGATNKIVQYDAKGLVLSGVDATPANVGAVPTSTTVCGHSLTSNVSCTSSDVGAVPTSTTVCGHSLTSNVSCTSSDVGAVAGSGTASGTTNYLTKKTSGGWGDSQIYDDGTHVGIGANSTARLTVGGDIVAQGTSYGNGYALCQSNGTNCPSGSGGSGGGMTCGGTCSSGAMTRFYNSSSVTNAVAGSDYLAPSACGTSNALLKQGGSCSSLVDNGTTVTTSLPLVGSNLTSAGHAAADCQSNGTNCPSASTLGGVLTSWSNNIRSMGYYPLGGQVVAGASWTDVLTTTGSFGTNPLLEISSDLTFSMLNGGICCARILVGGYQQSMGYNSCTYISPQGNYTENYGFVHVQSLSSYSTSGSFAIAVQVIEVSGGGNSCVVHAQAASMIIKSYGSI
jgi:hypothetical protein